MAYVEGTDYVFSPNGSKLSLMSEPLVYEFDSGDPDAVGDLVEFKITAGLKNGASHWVLGNVPAWTEVRRWKNWSTKARLIAGSYGLNNIFKGDSGGFGNDGRTEKRYE